MTKRTVVISCILCLLLGLSVGALLPLPQASDQSGTPVTVPGNTSAGSSSASSSSSSASSLDTTSNFRLLGAASYAVQTIRDRRYQDLASMVDPERGVTFTPYSTVNREADRTLSAAEVAKIGKDTSVSTWGFADGTGDPIQMTAKQYFETYVFDVDYTKAPVIGIDQIIMSGNALENLSEAYEGCRFVDYTYPGTDGTDWSSLRLVFSPGETDWQLVGVVHSQWTV